MSSGVEIVRAAFYSMSPLPRLVQAAPFPATPCWNAQQPPPSPSRKKTESPYRVKQHLEATLFCALPQRRRTFQ